MCIEYLKWDSNFFKFKIGKLDVRNIKDIQFLPQILEKAKIEDYHLIYVFTAENIFIENEGTLVDRKVVFSTDLRNLSSLEDLSSIVEYDDEYEHPCLLELSYVSGEYSRFRLDQNFTESEYKNLYKTWMINSIKKIIADKIYIYKQGADIKAMVSLKLDDGYASIGLISVLDDVRGRGIASLLISKCKEYAYNQGLKKMKVVTQIDNRKACNLYLKNEFKQESITNIYHFWL